MEELEEVSLSSWKEGWSFSDVGTRRAGRISLILKMFGLMATGLPAKDDGQAVGYNHTLLLDCLETSRMRYSMPLDVNILSWSRSWSFVWSSTHKLEGVGVDGLAPLCR